MDPGIRPVVSGTKLIGRALTVKCRDDFLTVVEALKTAEPDDVLVIDAAGRRRAVAGELFSTEAKRRKLAGIIIDGTCRDVAGLRRLGFPVYSRAIHPMAGTAAKIFEMQIPIICGGVEVRPGENPPIVRAW